MSYLFITLAGIFAGLGYYEWSRRSIWDNVEMGCLNICLIVLGALMTISVSYYVAATRLNIWPYLGLLYAGFFGTYLLLWLLECFEEAWKKKGGGDEDSP